MRVSDFIKKVTIPIVATILLFALFYPLCEQWWVRLPEIMDFDGYSVWDT